MRRLDVGLAVAAVAGVALATALDGDAYRFLLGSWPPLPVAVVAAGTGILALMALPRGGGGHLDSTAIARRVPSIRAITAAGVVLTLPAIALDLLGAFPPDLNAPLPGALLVYPTVAVLAELVLHVIPLGIAEGLARGVGRRGGAWIRGVGIVVACLVEPAFQVAWGVGRSPVWANAAVGVHLVAFDILAVVILRQRGFPNAVLFRLVYYAVWHLAWGRARLDLLF